MKIAEILGLLDENETVIPNLFYALDRVVRRSIIGDNNFDVLIGLSEDTFDGPRDEAAPIIGGNANRNTRSARRG